MLSFISEDVLLGKALHRSSCPCILTFERTFGFVARSVTRKGLLAHSIVISVVSPTVTLQVTDKPDFCSYFLETP